MEGLRYREDRPFKRRIGFSNVEECLVFDTTVKCPKCFVICVYRSPSGDMNNMDLFYKKFESTCARVALEYPITSFILGDSSSKSSLWWQSGVDNTCCLL